MKQESFRIFFEYYYVTAGNTFEILKEIRIKKLAGLIKRSMLENNATNIGSSAGAMIAGIDIRLALDFDRDTEFCFINAGKREIFFLKSEISVINFQNKKACQSLNKRLSSYKQTYVAAKLWRCLFC